ncbi:MAG: hemin uptake protein HemP [Acidovorax sp.]|uniref:hemin uptake protein HemP n=1 Tax=Acidovorax sp. TaxID=1872122 RepID=UPI0026201023|nr:hemin uptake protein HemP [Acidovorax sp.]MDH4466178.1 hemin uptake protein HemP [Acidovorax sp.]
MQATLTAATIMLRTPADDRHAAARTHALNPGEPAAAVDSSALLQGQKAVSISHNGSVYRLQATKLGKLILTK